MNKHPMTRPPSQSRRFMTLLFGLLASVLASSAAMAFQLVPIIQDFDPAGRGSNQTFQVENDRDEPITVTIAMAVRKVDLDGKETHEATDDFTLFPTEVLLQPKSSRLVRVKWVGDPAPKSELAYRIIAEETPLNMRRTTPGASLFLTIRYVGSVYVVPKNVRPDVVVASAQPVVSPQGSRLLELVLENKGLRHAVLDSPKVTVSAGGVTQTLNGSAVGETLTGENILAQSRRRFVLPLPADLPAGPVKAEFKYSLLP